MDQSLFVASQAGNILTSPRNNSAKSNKMNENLVHLMYKNPCYADSRNELGFALMHIASANGYLDIAKELVLRYGLRVCHLRGGQGDWTPLHCAASRGRLEIIRQIVSACPSSFQDVTRQWETALHIACKRDQIEAIVLLVQLVVDTKMIAVDSKRRIMNMKDELGDSVLHLAISKRQHYVVKCLVESGLVELNLVDNVGRTALDRVLGLEKINKAAYAAARTTEKILRDAGGLTARDLAARNFIHMPAQEKKYHPAGLRLRTSRPHQPAAAAY